MKRKTFKLDDKETYPPYKGPADEPLPERRLTRQEIERMLDELAGEEEA